MQRSFQILLISTVLWLPLSARAAAHTQAQLLLSAETARPGDSLIAGIRLSMAEGWHTYWRNPGESGQATTISWMLPAGITNGDIQWPPPGKLSEAGIATYIYTNEVVLLIPLSIGATVPAGKMTLKAKVSWLECEKQCVPGSDEVTAELMIGPETVLSKAAPVLGIWQKRLPKHDESVQVRCAWDGATAKDERDLKILCATKVAASWCDFYPYGGEGYEVGAGSPGGKDAAGQFVVVKRVKRLISEWPTVVPGLIVFGTASSDAPTAAYEVNLQGTPAVQSAAVKAQPFWLILIEAFVGGLILNVMPCVLPVIALKILGFVRQSQAQPARIRQLGLVYGGGVLFSFLVLASVVIAVQQTGHRAGWGMQFGNPQFLVALTVLVTLVALNLFGLFEVTLSGKIIGAAGGLAAKEGRSGAFFNGVLATVLATPCTAPYLGGALGFAFLQPPSVIVLVFLTVGAGLASPYVVLSWQPAWLKFLPKPGPWMERFKIAMGFPMLLTAIWLLSIVQSHYGDQVWWLVAYLAILGMAAWVFGEFFQRGNSRRVLAAVAVVVIIFGGYLYVIEDQLNWRHPSANANTRSTEAGGIPWQPWSASRVATSREARKPILVDFTARWCLTCQANYKISLNIPSVRKKLQEIGAVTLLADYTDLPEEITTELYRYQRSGVPLVLVYPKKPELPPIVLPYVLTPQIVLDALDAAARD